MIKIEPFPCKHLKCISYPVCVSKTYIKCDILYGWLHKNGHKSVPNLWNIISEHMKKVSTISGVKHAKKT